MIFVRLHVSSNSQFPYFVECTCPEPSVETDLIMSSQWCSAGVPKGENNLHIVVSCFQCSFNVFILFNISFTQMDGFIQIVHILLFIVTIILIADWLFIVVVQQLSLTDVENCFCFNFITLNPGYGNWVIASVLSWRFYGSHAGVLCRAHNWHTQTGQFSDRSTMELSCTRAPGHLSHSCEHRATL